MRNQSKQSKFSRFLCVSILIVGISIFSSMSVNATTDSDNPPSYSLLTPHDSIFIYSDYGFTIFPGSGTEEDPYPLYEPAEYSIDETKIFFTFTLLIVVVPLILIKLFSRKRQE